MESSRGSLSILSRLSALKTQAPPLPLRCAEGLVVIWGHWGRWGRWGARLCLLLGPLGFWGQWACCASSATCDGEPSCSSCSGPLAPVLPGGSLFGRDSGTMERKQRSFYESSKGNH